MLSLESSLEVIDANAYISARPDRDYDVYSYYIIYIKIIID